MLKVYKKIYLELFMYYYYILNILLYIFIYIFDEIIRLKTKNSQKNIYIINDKPNLKIIYTLLNTICMEYMRY